MANPANRGDTLGFDLYVGPQPGGGMDMSADARGCSGVELVINGMCARCQADTIPNIGSPGGVLDFGIDVRAWVGAPMTQGIANARSQQLAVVFARDPRIDPGSIVVAVSLSLAGAQYAFTIQIGARTTTGRPIALVLGVSSVTVDLLSQGSA